MNTLHIARLVAATDEIFVPAADPAPPSAAPPTTTPDAPALDDRERELIAEFIR